MQPKFQPVSVHQVTNPSLHDRPPACTGSPRGETVLAADPSWSALPVHGAELHD